MENPEKSSFWDPKKSGKILNIFKKILKIFKNLKYSGKISKKSLKIHTNPHLIFKKSLKISKSLEIFQKISNKS